MHTHTQSNEFKMRKELDDVISFYEICNLVSV